MSWVVTDTELGEFLAEQRLSVSPRVDSIVYYPLEDEIQGLLAE